jgi:P4 family phage/plasmid primase-like protien
MAATFDRADILRTAQLFHEPGDIFELRIPKAGKFGTISGYFDNTANFADSIIGLADEGFSGYYFTINQCNPDLLARAANRYEKYGRETTADKEILTRRWLPIDLDPIRPAGISSNEAEHGAAQGLAQEIRGWLISEGWPANAFILADSGNGGHLATRIDLPNDNTARDLIKHCLEALDFCFSDDKVKVDTSTFNAARIWKIYGTMARKGSDTPDRPHRLAKLLDVPETIETVSREQLEALAAILPKAEPIKSSNGQTFDPAKYAEEHGANVLRKKAWNGGTLAMLEVCPFDRSHNRGEAFLGVQANGARYFRCKHDSCKNHDWYALKALWGSPGSARGEKCTQEQAGPTVIDAIKALNAVCDGAATKDGTGFSKFDREEHEDLIKKAINDGYLSTKEEKTAYRFLKKYKKQLKVLGISCDEIGHLVRDEEDTCNGLAKVNDRIPAWIEEYHFKTVSDTERLYHYEHGVYLDDGEIILKALIEREFGDISDNRMVSDVIGKVKRRTYTDRDSFNNKNIVNVKNGLLDLETLSLQPHTPDYLSTAQIDVTYNEKAKAPKIQKFLKEVAQSGDIDLIEEIIGWLLWPDYNVHKALMLIGIGRNGKGTLLRLITAFLGKKSISNVTLQYLVGDRFAKADLYGKLANIGGDLPSKDLSDTAAFRNLTGGDDNRAQEKYRPAFSFRNKAKMAFSANVLPRSPDDTYAFYSRWILLEFLNRFDPQKGTGDSDLDAKLQTPEELSGLLNIALAGLKRLRANSWRFSYDKSVDDVERMYKRNSNPVYAFLLDECEPGEATDYIEKTLFYNRFKEYATDHGIRPLSGTKFSELLKDQTEVPVTTFRPWVDHGDRPMCWQGVKFNAKVLKTLLKPDSSKKKLPKTQKNIDSEQLQSTPSRVLATPSFRQNESGREKEEKEGKIGITPSIDGVDCASQISVSEQIRIACIAEYGVNGWVDPRKVAAKLHIELEEVVTWLEANYQPYQLADGSTGYKQKATA